MLLVEDDDLTRALLASELEGEGFVVAEAGDGEDGLCQVPGFRPDVVVLDLMLPRLNGFAVARAMRALERPPGVGIVAVTGLAAEALRAEALGAGCDVVLTKPVRVALLVERVRGLLSASRPDPSIDATPRVGKA